MSVVIPASVYRNKIKSGHYQQAQERGKIKLRLKSKDLLIALIGALLGQATLLEGLSPFGVAFLTIFASYHPQRLGLICLGVGVGSFISRGWLGLGVVVAAVVGIYMVRLWEGKIQHGLYKGMIVAGMVLGFHVFRYLIHQSDLYHLLMGVLEPMLILCIGWLFEEGLVELVNGDKYRLARINALAVLFLTAGIVIGLPRLELMGVQMGSVLIKTILLVIAFAGGITHSTVFGMFLGLTLTLTGYHNPVLVGLYGFIGLTTGFFREYGRLAVILGLFLSSMVFVGIEMVDFQIYMLVECLLVGIIFFVLPDSFITNIRRFLPGTSELLMQESEYQRELQQSFTERLDDISNLFSELATAFKEVVASDEEEDDVSSFMSVVSNRICKGCEYTCYCWDKQFYQTYTQMFKLLTVLENKGQAQGEDFVRLLKGHCRNLSRLKNLVDGSLELYQMHRHWNKRLKNQQAIVGEQLGEVSRIIDNFAKDIELSTTRKEDLERKLKNRCEENGLKVAQCRFSGDAGEDQISISVTKDRCLGEGECRRLFMVINQMVQQPMTNYERTCGLETGQSLCHLKFCPSQRFKVEVGYFNLPPEGEVVTGDTFAYQQLKSGKFMTILSDGMGTGTEAARESGTATRLVQKIIRAGFNHDLAVRTVNSALVSRSTDECFATIDLSFIDMFNGELEMVKIGATASFIKRGDDVNLVRGSSLPIGILENDFEPMTFKRRLQPGDYVVMMTDGVLDAVNIANKEDWMTRVIRQCCCGPAEDMARYIYDQAATYGIPDDDMTVVVLKLSEENIH